MDSINHKGETMKKTYLVTYQYNYGDPRTTKVKAESAYAAAKVVEKRNMLNYVLDVQKIG